jgi:FMN-dependent NADH-azoreductase
VSHHAHGLRMETLLVINSSARVTRSITRQLTERFAAAWLSHQPNGEVIRRDVGLHPVPAINEAWIASAFSDPSRHTEAMRRALARSNELIDELFRATAIVVGAPMYNFGMPAQLKAWVDQIVRVGRTFDFNPATPENPYLPLVPSRPVVIITSKGASGYDPGEHSAHLNFLEPHLETVFGLIGLNGLSFVRVGSEESNDDHFRQTLSTAERTVDDLARRLATGAATSTFHPVSA